MKRTFLAIAGLCVVMLGPVATTRPAHAQTVDCTGIAAWSGNSVSYVVGALVTYNGTEYKCIQAHTSQPGWDPVDAPSLWSNQGTCGSSTTGSTTGATCTSVPSAPSGLAASNTSSSGTTLTWNAVSAPADCSISSYTVYKGGTSIGTTSSTSFNVTGLSASTTYSFTVAATDAAGAGSQSASVSVTTSGSTSSGCYPAWVSTTAYNGGAQVSYNNVNYTAAYWTQGQNPSTNSGPAGSGQPWINDGACGTTATCTTVPSAPSGLAASNTSTTGTTLSWNAVTAPANCSISGYTVYQNGASIGAATGTTFTVSGLASATTYNFTVAATDAAGTGSQSASISVTTQSTTSCTTAPTAPTGLAASGTSSNSTTLSWNAVTPPSGCSISGYTVYQGSAAIATVSNGTSYTVGGLSASTTYAFTVTANDAAGASAQSAAVSVTTQSNTNSCSAAQWNSSTAYSQGAQVQYGGYLWQALYWTQGNTPQGGSSSPWNCIGYCGPLPGPAAVRRSMPYVDVTLTPPYNAMSPSVSKYYTMAFVTDGGGCTPAWNGKAVSTNQLSLSDVNNLRAAGGDVSLSFGGANNSELATTCPTVSALQSAYQSVINIYHLTQIDFDIEGGAVGNTTANDMRAKAIVGLQSANPGLRVSFTLPVETYGFDSGPMSLLQDAISNGVKIYAVNGMTMDFGGSYDHGGQMFLDQQFSAWSMMSQLQGLLPSYTHAQIAAMTSVTPMIGVNDNPGEIFQLSDASNTVSFATQQGMAEMGFWSESRDHSCQSGETNYLCSSISQSPSQFASIFDGFNN